MRTLRNALIRAVRSAAIWVLAHLPPDADHVADRRARDEQNYQDVLTAVRQAFADCGLPVHAFRPEFNILSTGKLAEVLVHAANHLNIAHPLVTVDEVVAVLLDDYDAR